MEDFFKLISTGECTALLDRFTPLASETVPLSAALGRVLAADVVARELLPPFSRSTMAPRSANKVRNVRISGRVPFSSTATGRAGEPPSAINFSAMSAAVATPI